jgi:N-acetyl-anhydromuramyl-L-alanine amidase AmpD
MTTNQSIVACGHTVDIETPVVLWHHAKGYACPHPRGRRHCSQHNPQLNGAPTREYSKYQIKDLTTAYEELQQSVYQFVLHYDVCYSSHHCHQVLKDSTFKGSHFYLDLDGTIYQTCDLYWKTNTAPADDRQGNERAVHIEMANLSWQALAEESDLYHVKKNLYRKVNGRWRFDLPEKFQKRLHTLDFKPFASRAYGERGYFSRNINGRMVRMWDFTEEQYQALIRLCFGINQLLPKVALKVPYDKEKQRTPLGKIKNFSTFKGILGHAHVQGGTGEGVKKKYDPGSAFNWGRLRRSLLPGGGTS